MSLLFALAALLVADAALARIDGAPVRARIERPRHLTTEGTELTTTIVLEAARAVDLRGLRLAGEGWTVNRWDGPRDLALSVGNPLRFTLSATPRQGYGRLMLSAEVDGKPWQQSFDLSREAYGGILPTDSDELPPRRFLPAVTDGSSVLPQLTYADLAAMATAEPAPAVAFDKSRTACTVTGTVIYLNDRTHTWMPPTGVYVWLLLRAANGSTYSVGTQQLDGEGHFSVEITDDTDFWVAWSATSNAAVVQTSGIWEEDYVWISTKYHTTDGASNYHTGILSPASHPGALHICVDVTYAHDHFGGLGWDTSQVDVQWPIDDGSAYNPFWDELYIERGDAWYDETICHEWAHYFHDQHGHTMDVDYCNGICDDGDDCGHCVWCPEGDDVTWIEGVADFLSRINTDYIGDVQDFYTPTQYGLDSYVDDSTCDWLPWNIEFVFGGVVWDMVDFDRGTETMGLHQDTLGQPLYDQLRLDTADILTVLCSHCDTEGHEPYRQPAFYRCAYEYLAEQNDPSATAADLWETAMSWGLDTDDGVPNQVMGITCSLPVGQPTSISLAHFGWSVPWDDASGVCAYSITLHLGHSLAPDTTPEITDNWYNTPQMSPGSWYFGIRAVDRSGRWSMPTYVGPIIVTAPGPADLAFETPSGWAAPLVARSTTVGAPPAPVSQPNYVSGSQVYFNWAGRNGGTGPSGNVKDYIYLDGTQVYTGGIYYVAPTVGFQHRDKGPVNTGTYGRHTVWVKLDGENAAAETNEENNFYAKQFVFSPFNLDYGDIGQIATALPNPTSGQEYLPSGTPFYSNCMGFDIETCFFYPDMVWMAPKDADNRLVARMHTRDVGQTGFAAPLVESTSTADTPAAVIQVPSETMMMSYCVGLAKGQPAGPISDVGYRYCREIAQAFAMPDTVPASITGDDCLDFYYAYNNLNEEAWFTIKLVNHNTAQLKLRLFEPGFAMGGLADADVTVHVAQGDTSYYSILLPPSEMAIAVVSRDFRLTGTSLYTIYAYNAKPDPATSTPDGWFANTVPQIGTPYDAASEDIPAPAALTGGSATTGIYWSLKNESPEAGVPIGLRHEVAVDGSYLFGGVFVEPLLPGQEVKAVHGSLANVRGGRHTLSHRLNTNNAIEEDNWGNNRHGRQWVWSSQSLAANTVFALPSPSNPFGGLTLVTEGTVALNCDGYRPTTPINPVNPTIVAAYATSAVHDVDLGVFTGSTVQEGFTTDLIMSQWSGPGCDFVLRGVAVHGTTTYNLGVIRAGGPSSGDYTLATQWSTDVWENPIDYYERGTVEAGTYLDALYLDLPPGGYRLTLRSREVDLGFSLHDFSARVAAKTEPWQDGIAWQTPDASDVDVSFVVTVPEVGTPSDFALVVWRPDGTSVGLDGAWQVLVTEVVTGVDGDDTVPTITASRLVSAAPNPFNPMTEIVFEVAQSGRCELTVHDVRGRLVRTLVAGDLPAGRHEERWDGLDDAGQRVPSGIYMARLRTVRGEVDLLKLTLVK
jgi:hypothetical protein